jgi:transcriptional regulator with XRE-family HTH domain
MTRNMLSCIENGTASPSLASLRHIASKLNVTAGYLLADGDDELMYLKFSEMVNIKNAYLSKNTKICRDMCLNASFDRDDEINLIYAESALDLAIESFNAGCLREACSLFDEAIEISESTIYYTEHIKAIAATYFRYMRLISATLASDVIDENNVEVFNAMSDEFSRYAVAFEAIENNNLAIAAQALSRLDPDIPYALHINAKLDMKEGRYNEAYDKLYLILTNPYKIQEPLMYFVFCDLEICCKERKDFKGAYEYSNDKLEVLQKILSDN